MMRAVICLLFATMIALAEPSAIPLSVAAGGAQRAVAPSGAAIRATIGQSAIVRMANANGSTHNGFWPGVNSAFPNPVRDQRAPLPNDFAFSPAFPNPFNPSTVLNFSLPKTSEIQLNIFDVTGRLVATPVSGKYQAGVYSTLWSPEHLASGVYFARLDAKGFSNTQRLHLVK